LNHNARNGKHKILQVIYLFKILTAQPVKLTDCLNAKLWNLCFCERNRTATATSDVQTSDLRSYHCCMPLLELLRSELSITRRRSVRSRRKQKGLTFVATNSVVSLGSFVVMLV